jgi:hypothetical protein
MIAAIMGQVAAYRAQHLKVEDALTTITLDRPARANPLTFDSYAEMAAILPPDRPGTRKRVALSPPLARGRARVWPGASATAYTRRRTCKSRRPQSRRGSQTAPPLRMP